MIVNGVTIYVKKEHVADFIAATMENHKGSLHEHENLRFDVLQCADDPCKFFLYEVYASEEGAREHKNTPHYLAWRDAVAGWMEKPREGVKYNVICPKEKNLW